MPTIAEIIAAKKAKEHAAATGQPAPQAAPPARRETLAEAAEAKAAIDRIDPPGKSERATAARKSAGLILSKAMPERPDMTPPPDDEPRALGARVGQALTVVPDEAPPQSVAWDAILNRWETDLVIMADPEPGSEAAWLALKPGTGGGLPVLLHKLPFWPHPQRKQPPDEPF